MYRAEQAAAFISHCIASDWNQFVVPEAVKHAPKEAVRAVLIGFLPCHLVLLSATGHRHSCAQG